MDLAGKHNLRVIEDAAQALGATYRGRSAGSIGDFGAFSFFPSKNLGGLGEGGLLVTGDDELAARARLMRAHGAEHKYFHKVVGGNFRMHALFAALLLVKAPHLDEYTRGRVANAAYYTAELGRMPGVELSQAQNPSSGARVLLPSALPHNGHIWNQYTLRVLHNRRDALQKFLASREIQPSAGSIIPGRYTCKSVSLHSAGQSPEPLPVSEQLAVRKSACPIFPPSSGVHSRMPSWAQFAIFSTRTGLDN